MPAPPIPATFTITGTKASDSLTALPAGSRIRGLAGADTLTGLGGNDALVGDAGSDRIAGGFGNDTLWAIAGADTLSGEAGNDVLVAGSGAASLAGGVGSDTLWGANGPSAATLSGGDGADVISGGGLLLGDGGNDRLTGGRGNDTLVGGDGHDRLAGGLGADSLVGGAGDDVFTLDWTDLGDTLAGGARAFDTVAGGLGDDTYVLTADIIDTGLPAGWLVELAGGGRDRIIAALDVAITLPDNVEDLDYSARHDNSGNAAVGNGLGNRISGRSAGTLVAIMLDGKGGNDTLTNAGETVSRLMGGLGRDLLIGNVFEDSLYGGAADRMEGRGGDDLLSGAEDGAAAAADTLLGQDGNDRLESTGGGDRLDGGAGTDLAVLDFSWRTSGLGFDVAGAPGVGIEDTVAGEGIVLRDIEAFFVTGSRGDDWFELDLDELIGGADTLRGGRGNDTLTAGAGNDLLEGGDGDDTLNGRPGDDRLAGGTGNDELFGYAGADTVDGGTGRDWVTGGTGSDRLTDTDRSFADTLLGEGDDDLVSSQGGGDSLSGGAGVDRLVLDLSWRSNPLGFTAPFGFAIATVGGDGTQVREFEIYSLSGGSAGDVFSLAISGGLNLLSGHGGADHLTGGFATDTLDGGDGADTLVGGSGADRTVGGPGADVHVVDNPGDIVVEAAGGGFDEIRSETKAFVLPAHVERLVVLGFDAIGYAGAAGGVLAGVDGPQDLVGGQGADTLSGEGGADTLSGGAAADTLAGGGGEDLLRGGDGGDTLAGGADDDTLGGEADDDRLAGDAGADLLAGQDGLDTLAGGAGQDRFRFAGTGLGRDRIEDFAPGEDLLQFVSSGFGFIGPGFGNLLVQSGTAGSGFGAQFILDTDTAMLWFDRDGEGFAQAEEIAVFATAPALTAADLEVVFS